MANNEKKILEKISGVNKEILTEILDDNAIKNIQESNNPQFFKNAMLVFHLALKTLCYKNVESVFFSVGNSVTFNTQEQIIDGKRTFKKSDKAIPQAEVCGDISFKNRQRLVDFKYIEQAPSNASWDMRSYQLKPGNYKSFAKEILESVKPLELNDKDMFDWENPEYKKYNFNFSINSFNRDFLKCIDDNSYLFSIIMKNKILEKMNNIDNKQTEHIENANEDEMGYKI